MEARTTVVSGLQLQRKSASQCPDQKHTQSEKASRRSLCCVRENETTRGRAACVESPARSPALRKQQPWDAETRARDERLSLLLHSSALTAAACGR